MIKWKKFDQIYYIFKTSDGIERYHSIIDMLKKVGLFYRDNFKIYYQTNNFHYQDIFDVMLKKDDISVGNNEKSFKTKEQFFNTLAVYNILSEAKVLKFKNVLLLNGIEFIQDIDQIRSIISKAPLTVDIVSMSETCSEERMRVQKSINECYKWNQSFSNQLDCVSLSNRGIKYIYQFMTQSLKPFSYYMSFRNTARDFAITRATCTMKLNV